MRVIICVLVIGAIVGAWFLGLEPAMADSCYVQTGTQPSGCECTSSSCGECDQGTCPGNERRCAPEVPVFELLEDSGFSSLTLYTYKCFALHSCEPEDDETNCVPGSIGCVASSDYTESTSTYSCPYPNNVCFVLKPPIE